MQIDHKLFDKYLDVKVHKQELLFDLDYKDIQWVKENKRCPKCGNKLKLPRGKPIAYCRNPKVHYQQFIISLEKLNK